MQFSLTWLRDYVDAGEDVPALVHRLTMAGLPVERVMTGAEIPESSRLHRSLSAAIAAGDPVLPVRVQSYDRREGRFRLAAGLRVDPQRRLESVLAAVRQALLEAFSFERRDFGQAVSASEVISVIQAVPGEP